MDRKELKEKIINSIFNNFFSKILDTIFDKLQNI
jgi:hypothetical protein